MTAEVYEERCHLRPVFQGLGRDDLVHWEQQELKEAHARENAGFQSRHNLMHPTKK